MRRALLFVVCLSFVLMSFVPLTAPVAAQEVLPTGFLGRWEGVTLEAPTPADVPVIIELTGGRLGAVVGTIDLPQHACGGDLRLQRVSADGRQIEVADEITYGQACIQGGIIALTLQSEDALAYFWSHPTVAVTASGTIPRTSAPVEPPIAPTSTPLPPTPTAVVVPTAPPSASGRVVIADDFSNPAASVVRDALRDPSRARSTFDSGVFVVEQLAVDSAGATDVWLPGTYVDTTMTIDVWLGSAAPGQYAGLVCRDFYALLVDPSSGSFSLFREQETALVPWTTSPAINAVGTAGNRLELICVGETIAARINGIEVAAVQDATYQEGRLAFGLGVWDDYSAETAEGQFDNLGLIEYGVSSPTPPPALAPTAAPAQVAALPATFVRRWEGIVGWDDATMPVALNLIGGRVGEVVGTVEYALYESAGPRCGGDVWLQSIEADGSAIELVGTIAYDPTVCLVDATITISLRADGGVAYLWSHPLLTVTGTGTLLPVVPTN